MAKTQKNPKKVKKEEPRKGMTKEEKAKVKKLEGEIKVLTKDIKSLEKQSDALYPKMCSLVDQGPNFGADEAISYDLKEFPRICKKLGINSSRYIKACRTYLDAWKVMDKLFSKEKDKLEDEEGKLQAKMDDLGVKIAGLKEKLRKLKPDHPDASPPCTF